MESEIKQHRSSTKVWGVCRRGEGGRDKASGSDSWEGLEELKGRREEEHLGAMKIYLEVKGLKS